MPRSDDKLMGNVVVVEGDKRAIGPAYVLLASRIVKGLRSTWCCCVGMNKSLPQI